MASGGSAGAGDGLKEEKKPSFFLQTRAMLTQNGQEKPSPQKITLDQFRPKLGVPRACSPQSIAVV
jgi:hypothetical protein